MRSEGLASAGKWCFLAGVFLMVTGDGLTNIHKPVASDAWPWLYLVPFVAALVLTGAAGRIALARTRARASVVYAPIAALLVAFALSTAFSQERSLSLLAFGLVLGIAVFWWFAAQILEDDWLAEATWIVAALAVIELSIRVIMWRLAEGLDRIPVQIWTVAWIGKLQIAWVLTLFAPFLVARFIGDRRRLVSLFNGIAWAAAGAANVLLFSRAGTAVFLVTTLAVCLMNVAHWRRWLPLMGAAAIGGGIVVANSLQTVTFVVSSFFDTARNPGIEMRFDVWREAWRMFLAHPIVGIGIGTFDKVTYLMPGTKANRDFYLAGWHAHNVFLHVLTEAGVLGLAAWVFLWVVIVRTLVRVWRTGDNQRRLYSSAALVTVLAFLFLSMTEVLIAARAAGSLRMNLTIALLVVTGLRMALRDKAPVFVERSLVGGKRRDDMAHPAEHAPAADP